MGSAAHFLRSGYWLVPAAWAALVVHWSSHFGAAYTPDSFAYYLLGHNVFAGHGYASQAIRDFYIGGSAEFFQPSRSFPPLMPLLVGTVDALSGKGIASGLIANLLLTLALFHTYFALAAKLAGRFAWAMFLVLPAFLFFETSPDSLTGEILAGRAMALAALLCCSVLLVLCSNHITPRRAALLGVLLALLYLTRFDSAVFVAALVAGLAFFKVVPLRWLVGAFLLALAPWLARNLIAFGSPLASDNAITALSTFPSIVPISAFEHDAVPMLWHDPGLWAMQRAENLVINSQTYFGLLTPLGTLAATVVCALAMFSPRSPRPVKILVALAALWTIANLLAVSLTPYHDARYFSLAAFLTLAAAAASLTALAGGCPAPQGTEDPACEHAPAGGSPPRGLALVTLAIAVTLVTPLVAPKIDRLRGAEAYRQLHERFAGEVGVGDLVASSSPEELAYHSSWRTIYLPLNRPQPDAAFLQWQRKFAVPFALLPPDSPIARHPGVIVKGWANGVILVDLRNMNQ